jgi:catechol 2,3-dioxygenase-like lactoylglutathione lyase family enzyme
MFQGLRTVIYPVADIEAAKAWYSKVLGFPPYFDEPFYVGYNVGGYELGLIPRDDADNDAGPLPYWGVPDASAAVHALIDAGAAPNAQPEDVGGGIVVASVRDPDGNAVGVIYNPNFKLEGTG